MTLCYLLYFSCVSAMGRELNEFETCADLKEENRQLKEKLAAFDKTRKEAKDLLDVKPDDTAHGLVFNYILSLIIPLLEI